MKKLFFLIIVFLIGNHAQSQEILSIVFNQKIPIYSVRSIESATIDELKPNDLIYIEPSTTSLVKIRFYSQTQNDWREGFADQKFIQPIGNSTKSDKIRFSVSYLKDFVKLSSQTKLYSDYLANNFNLLIDEFLELSCQHKNQPVTRHFIKALFNIDYVYDEKHLYALEELYRCQKATFLELLNKEEASVQNKINEYISEW